jgi:hypothetical protein
MWRRQKSIKKERKELGFVVFNLWFTTLVDLGLNSDNQKKKNYVERFTKLESGNRNILNFFPLQTLCWYIYNVVQTANSYANHLNWCRKKVLFRCLNFCNIFHFIAKDSSRRVNFNNVYKIINRSKMMKKEVKLYLIPT